MSDRIWELAETALREEQSAKVLADYAEAKGFKVERGVAGLPTAFVASYGEGRPVIAIMGEYDALPGISQKASAAKESFREGAAGHGCGHNLFGAASLGAAVAKRDDCRRYAEGNDPVPRHAGGGVDRRQDLHDSRRRLQGRRCGAGVASG
jgi:aminobenzoyl-glutamate utilization protein B